VATLIQLDGSTKYNSNSNSRFVTLLSSPSSASKCEEFGQESSEVED
jgi:hypothetical protein